MSAVRASPSTRCCRRKVLERFSVGERGVCCSLTLASFGLGMMSGRTQLCALRFDVVCIRMLPAPLHRQLGNVHAKKDLNAPCPRTVYMEIWSRCDEWTHPTACARISRCPRLNAPLSSTQTAQKCLFDGTLECSLSAYFGHGNSGLIEEGTYATTKAQVSVRCGRSNAHCASTVSIDGLKMSKSKRRGA